MGTISFFTASISHENASSSGWNFIVVLAISVFSLFNARMISRFVSDIFAEVSHLRQSRRLDFMDRSKRYLQQII